jgi:glyoxylase-like metal-dependent hydrolase (beta-lactamase superfamily II)
MEALGLTPENTEIFLTHIHADHTGNAKHLGELGYRILMGEKDYQGVIDSHLPGFYGAKQKSIDAGTPEDVLDAMFVHNPTPIMLPEYFKADTITDGQIMEYGGHRLKAIATYGHSPGHMSLWDEENGILFLGDHVLFDITPNIVLWTKHDDALAEYIANLKKVKSLPVKVALPAHRTVGDSSLNDRIDDIIRHHQLRIQEVLDIIGREPGMNAYQISTRMKWNIHGTDWDSFPATQKYFAVCECMAHLQHMTLTGLIRCQADAEGISRYYI